MKCVVCTNKRFTILFSHHKNWKMGRCLACGLVQVVPMPSQTEINALYHEDMEHFEPYIDQSVPISELASVLRHLKKHPVAVASRRLSASKILVHQSRSREIAGRLFTYFSNMVCDTHSADVTCGFKGFRKDAAHKLFRLRRIDRWVFDTELMFLAGKYGMSVKEFPVSWTNKSGSKVRVWDTIVSFADLFRIRWYDWRGCYNNNKS